MKTLRNFSFALAVCLSASWLLAQFTAAVGGRQSNAMTSQPLLAQAQRGTAAVPIKAVLISGQTGDIVSESTLTFTTVDVPGAVVTSIQGINTAGDMVGLYQDVVNGPYHAFLLSGGTFTFFDYPGASGTLAYGINDSGLIVGYAEFENDSVWLGFEYDGTTFVPIRNGKNSATVSFGINNAGSVVGGDGTVYATKGFELRGQTFKPIVPPGNYVYIYATGINKLGEVVGWTAGGCSLYDCGYDYANGKFHNVDFPGSDATEAWGINDRRVIVGWYGMGSNAYAFALNRGKYLSLGYPDAVATFGGGINASGQIVGDYTLDYETYHGFITSPLTPADFPPDQ